MNKGLLVATYGMFDVTKEMALEHVEELAELAKTYGVEQIEQAVVALRKIEKATYVTKGKLEELVAEFVEKQCTFVCIDEEISPAQQRNLEQAFGALVMDRTELILKVFAQRAQTKEARLQVALAQIQYDGPRLKRLWTHLSRQRGTGGGKAGAYLKGEGEKQIEIDRRLLKEKATSLRRELDAVVRDRHTQRKGRKRQQVPTFSFIGYTNAGKSTLLNALCHSDVYVQDQLFATLDTTTRQLLLPQNQEVLVTDTVGFIRKLPHQLVAAFKSTLEESLEADVLVIVIDAHHRSVFEQVEAVYAVLEEMGVKDKPILHAFNQIDRVEDWGVIQRLKIKYSKHVTISATSGEGLHDLKEKMLTELEQLRVCVMMRIPQSEFRVVADLEKHSMMIKKEYEENDVLIQARVPCALANKYSRYVER